MTHRLRRLLATVALALALAGAFLGLDARPARADALVTGAAIAESSPENATSENEQAVAATGQTDESHAVSEGDSADGDRAAETVKDTTGGGDGHGRGARGKSELLRQYLQGEICGPESCVWERSVRLLFSLHQVWFL